MTNTYKPLYKKFIRLKITVNNKNKFVKFRKNKWNVFKHNFIKFHCRKKTIFNEKFFLPSQSQYKFYDHSGFSLPLYENYYKNKFKFLIHTKQKLSLFYGGLGKRYLKNLLQTSISNYVNHPRSYNLGNYLINTLESRLDTILYRSKFSISFRNARALIHRGQVYVNGKIRNKNSYLMKKGDIISIRLKSHSDIKRNILYSNMWPIPQKYLNVNYKTLEILFTGNLNYYNLTAYFPFCLNSSYFFYFYRL